MARNADIFCYDYTKQRKVVKGMISLFSKRDLLRMIFPMIIQQILAIMVSTINSVMVSSAGEAAVSGVLLVGSLDTLLVITFSSLVTGGSVAISHARGSGDKPFARECAKQLIFVATGIALTVTVVVGIFRVQVLNGLYGSAEADVLKYANDYLSVILLSFPFLAIYNSGVAIFRVMGNTVVGMWLSLATNILNIAGNAVFIMSLQMASAGAAISTLIARAICAVVIVVLLHSRKNDIYLEKLHHYHPNFEVIKRMLRVGVPHGIESSMFEFGRLATQVLISGMGTVVIAANSVANTLANYHYLAHTAIANAVITVVGRCYGAKELGQAKKYSRILLLWTYICMWAVSVVLFLFAKPIIGAYHLSEKGAEIALQLTLFHCVFTSAIRPLGFTLPSVFKAAGDVKYSMVVSTVSMWTVRVGLAYVLSLDSVSLFGVTIPGVGLGIMGVWVAMVIDWGIRGLLFTVRFLRGTWLKAEKAKGLV